mmetsp:Transcript_37060/g.97128  ORF Transcript_37060/g.97128 Transcript_37060/m.97128 type:complete len:204 (-) Transcript_37060:1843-2454(-)
MTPIAPSAHVVLPASLKNRRARRSRIACAHRGKTALRVSTNYVRALHSEIGYASQFRIAQLYNSRPLNQPAHPIARASITPFAPRPTRSTRVVQRPRRQTARAAGRQSARLQVTRLPTTPQLQIASVKLFLCATRRSSSLVCLQPRVTECAKPTPCAVLLRAPLRRLSQHQRVRECVYRSLCVRCKSTKMLRRQQLLTAVANA